ncbi:MAG: SRPBCC domain-containing protein [Chloroflexi bacterium]|nr:SRPBCC domain-containing protein [Chloroflexota bacterium]
MAPIQPIAAIERVFSVPLDNERAFALFTQQMMLWWPPEYTWSNDVLVYIGMEPLVGGRCFERGPEGFEIDWGRVLVWEPPHRLILRWQISPHREPEPNPAKASEIEVRFSVNTESSTWVSFEHRHFEWHGGESEVYRNALDAPEGWTAILERYAQVAGAMASI